MSFFNKKEGDLYERNYAPLHVGESMRDDLRAAGRELNQVMKDLVTGHLDYSINGDGQTIRDTKKLMSEMKDAYGDLEEMAKKSLNTILDNISGANEATKETNQDIQTMEQAIYDLWPELRNLVNQYYLNVDKENKELRSENQEQALRIQAFDIRDTQLSNTDATSRGLDKVLQQITELTTQRQEDRSAAIAQVTDLTARLQIGVNERQILQFNTAAQATELEKIRGQLIEHQKVSQENDQLRHDKHNAANDILAEKAEVARLKSDLFKVEIKLNTLEQTKEALKNQVADQSLKIVLKENSLSQTDRCVSVLEQEKVDWKRKEEGLKTKIASLEISNNSKSGSIDFLNGQIVHQDLQIQKLETKISNHNHLINEKSSSLFKAEGRINNLISTVEHRDTDLVNTRKELDKLRQDNDVELQNLRQEITTKQVEITCLQANPRTADRQDVRSDREQHLIKVDNEQLRTKKAELERQVTDLKGIKRELEQEKSDLIKENATLIEGKAALVLELEEVQRQIRWRDANIRDLDSKLEKVRNDYEQQTDCLKKVREDLSKTQADVQCLQTAKIVLTEDLALQVEKAQSDSNEKSNLHDELQRQHDILHDDHEQLQVKNDNLRIDLNKMLEERNTYQKQSEKLTKNLEKSRADYGSLELELTIKENQENTLRTDLSSRTDERDLLMKRSEAAEQAVQQFWSSYQRTRDSLAQQKKATSDAEATIEHLQQANNRWKDKIVQERAESAQERAESAHITSNQEDLHVQKIHQQRQEIEHLNNVVFETTESLKGSLKKEAKAEALYNSEFDRRTTAERTSKDLSLSCQSVEAALETNGQLLDNAEKDATYLNQQLIEARRESKDSRNLHEEVSAKLRSGEREIKQLKERLRLSENLISTSHGELSDLREKWEAQKHRAYTNEKKANDVYHENSRNVIIIRQHEATSKAKDEDLAALQRHVDNSMVSFSDRYQKLYQKMVKYEQSFGRPLDRGSWALGDITITRWDGLVDQEITNLMEVIRKREEPDYVLDRSKITAGIVSILRSSETVTPIPGLNKESMSSNSATVDRTPDTRSISRIVTPSTGSPIRPGTAASMDTSMLEAELPNLQEDLRPASPVDTLILDVPQISSTADNPMLGHDENHDLDGRSHAGPSTSHTVPDPEDSERHRRTIEDEDIGTRRRRSESALSSRDGSVTSTGAEYALDKIQYLVSGKPADGVKTQDVHPRLVKQVRVQVEEWTKRNKHWAKGCEVMRCVGTRIGKFSTAKAPVHGDPEHKTACPRCTKNSIPCILIPLKSPPIVLPLSTGNRKRGVTPRDVGYYVCN